MKKLLRKGEGNEEFGQRKSAKLQMTVGACDDDNNCSWMMSGRDEADVNLVIIISRKRCG